MSIRRVVNVFPSANPVLYRSPAAWRGMTPDSPTSNAANSRVRPRARGVGKGTGVGSFRQGGFNGRVAVVSGINFKGFSGPRYTYRPARQAGNPPDPKKPKPRRYEATARAYPRNHSTDSARLRSTRSNPGSIFKPRAASFSEAKLDRFHSSKESAVRLRCVSRETLPAARPGTVGVESPPPS